MQNHNANNGIEDKVLPISNGSCQLCQGGLTLDFYNCKICKLLHNMHKLGVAIVLTKTLKIKPFLRGYN